MFSLSSAGSNTKLQSLVDASMHRMARSWCTLTCSVSVWRQRLWRQRYEACQINRERKVAKHGHIFYRRKNPPIEALLHSKFLNKRAHAIQHGEIWAGAPVKRMPANFLETVGLDCALCPRLYWTTSMCETRVRSQDKRRLQSLGKKWAQDRMDVY